MEPIQLSASINGQRYDTAMATLLADDAYWDGTSYERGGRNRFLFRTQLRGLYFVLTRSLFAGEEDEIEPLSREGAEALWEELPRRNCSFEEAFPASVVTPIPAHALAMEAGAPGRPRAAVADPDPNGAAVVQDYALPPLLPTEGPERAPRTPDTTQPAANDGGSLVGTSDQPSVANVPAAAEVPATSKPSEDAPKSAAAPAQEAVPPTQTSEADVPARRGRSRPQRAKSSGTSSRKAAAAAADRGGSTSPEPDPPGESSPDPSASAPKSDEPPAAASGTPPPESFASEPAALSPASANAETAAPATASAADGDQASPVPESSDDPAQDPEGQDEGRPETEDTVAEPATEELPAEPDQEPPARHEPAEAGATADLWLDEQGEWQARGVVRHRTGRLRLVAGTLHITTTGTSGRFRKKQWTREEAIPLEDIRQIAVTRVEGRDSIEIQCAGAGPKPLRLEHCRPANTLEELLDQVVSLAPQVTVRRPG